MATTPATPAQYDGQQLLDAFRETNNSARHMAHIVDPEDSEAFRNGADTFAQQATEAADAAEYAIQALQDGDSSPALRFLDQMKHALGMMSLEVGPESLVWEVGLGQ